MPRVIPIAAGLQKIKNVVDDMIRRGELDSFDSRPQLHQMNSAVYSDLRAALIQKAKNSQSVLQGKKDHFTVSMLSEVAKTDGNTPAAEIRKRYVSTAKDMDRV